VAAAALLAGCSLDSGNPIAPTGDDSDGFVALDNAASAPQFVRYIQPSERGLAKTLGHGDDDSDDDDKYIEKKIRKSRGGRLKLGDEETVEIELKIHRKSIPQDEIISMALPEDDILVIGIGGEDGITFGPHGLTFDPHADLKIESEILVLPEGDLYLYCQNEETGEWEETDAKVKVKVRHGEVTLEAKVPHFSHYAFGSRR